MSSFRAYREWPVGGINERSRPPPPIMGSGHWPGGTAPGSPGPFFEKIVPTMKKKLFGASRVFSLSGSSAGRYSGKRPVVDRSSSARASSSVKSRVIPPAMVTVTPDLRTRHLARRQPADPPGWRERRNREPRGWPAGCSTARTARGGGYGLGSGGRWRRYRNHKAAG